MLHTSLQSNASPPFSLPSLDHVHRCMDKEDIFVQGNRKTATLDDLYMTGRFPPFFSWQCTYIYIIYISTFPMALTFASNAIQLFFSLYKTNAKKMKPFEMLLCLLLTSPLISSLKYFQMFFYYIKQMPKR